jgi:DNA-binding NarL/FixJ family response regulator
MAIMTDPVPSPGDAAYCWRDLFPDVAGLPGWLPRIALAELVSRELLVVAEDSSGSSCVPGGCSALLARLEAMLAELRLDDPDLTRTRHELLTAGLARRYPSLAIQLANWACESRDWSALETLWGTYSPGVLLANRRVRAAYAEAPPERRAALPALSYGAALTGAFDPVTGRLDLDLLVGAMIRDGRTLHARWETKATPDARVAAGTLWMLAQATIPEAVGDQRLDGAARTYRALLQLIREPAPDAAPVGAKSLSFFHATASLVAFLRADWARARRDAELAMILTESCGFAGFLATLVLAMSSGASGNTQYFDDAERYLIRHAEHQCRVATWIEPAFHLAWSDAALRRLDHRLAERHLRMHELEGAATRWFNLQPMHAELIATFGRLWDDPQRVLAQFDSILADAGLVRPTSPWRAHLLRLRAELLIDMGELNRAAPLVEDLLEHGDPAIAVVPAARLHLAVGDHAQAVARADEGIFSLEVSLADRAHLYAIKAAALHLARADQAAVAVAASAACVVGAQAATLLPFALLPSGLRAELLDDHADHHGVDCFVGAARGEGTFDALRNSRTPRPNLVRLTRREEVLLPLLATTATVQAIADQQFVSVNTVRKQVVALREKFGVSSRADLIRRAHDAGLLDPGHRRLA